MVISIEDRLEGHAFKSTFLELQDGAGFNRVLATFGGKA